MANTGALVIVLFIIAARDKAIAIVVVSCSAFLADEVGAAHEGIR